MAVADPEDAEEAVVELDSDSDAAGGTEDETPNDVAGTDDDVPSGGENYFGRAAKEGAAPVGANPFAMPAPSADDDWMREIEEAKRMVEAQRIKREREEAVAAAEGDRGRGGQREGVRGTTQGWGFAGTGVRYGRTEARTENRPSQTADGGRRAVGDADVRRRRRRRRRREPVRGVQLRAAARVHPRAHGGYTRTGGESFRRGVLAAVHSGGDS